MQATLLALSIVSLIFGVLGFTSSIFALVKILAVEKSTHQIVYHDPFSGEEIGKTKDPYASPVSESSTEDRSEADWGLSEDDVLSINKKAKEYREIY